MKYRRFGRTNLPLPVLTGGGMRYQAPLKMDRADEIPPESDRNVAECIRYGLDRGINHIETARGYGTSELQIGRAIAGIPRDRFILQTKVPVTETGDEFRRCVFESLERLGVDYVDMLAIHGINNADVFATAAAPGGCREAADALRREGRVRFVGMASHGSPKDLVPAIESGLFDYVNLHYFYIMSHHWPSVVAAACRDMGVLIISPNDKGGKLYDPPEKLRELCRPFDPMTWHDLFLLRHNQIHTLSIGAASPGDYDLHLRAVEMLDEPGTVEQAAEVESRLTAAAERAVGRDLWHRYWEGLPHFSETAGQVNVRAVVWLMRLVRAFDLVSFAKFRYNLLGHGGHWFPGNNTADLTGADMDRLLARSPLAAEIRPLLETAHETLADAPTVRIST